MSGAAVWSGLVALGELVLLAGLLVAVPGEASVGALVAVGELRFQLQGGGQAFGRETVPQVAA